MSSLLPLLALTQRGFGEFLITGGKTHIIRICEETQQGTAQDTRTNNNNNNINDNDNDNDNNNIKNVV